VSPLNPVSVAPRPGPELADEQLLVGTHAAARAGRPAHPRPAHPARRLQVQEELRGDRRRRDLARAEAVAAARHARSYRRPPPGKRWRFSATLSEKICRSRSPIMAGAPVQRLRARRGAGKGPGVAAGAVVDVAVARPVPPRYGDAAVLDCEGARVRRQGPNLGRAPAEAPSLNQGVPESNGLVEGHAEGLPHAPRERAGRAAGSAPPRRHHPRQDRPRGRSTRRRILPWSLSGCCTSAPHPSPHETAGGRHSPIRVCRSMAAGSVGGWTFPRLTCAHVMTLAVSLRACSSKNSPALATFSASVLSSSTQPGGGTSAPRPIVDEGGHSASFCLFTSYRVYGIPMSDRVAAMAAQNDSADLVYP
jgi:hypothetical protein